MAEERFIVAYDGPALADHSMNARDLASAILALSDAFHQAQHVLAPGAPPASLSVHAFDPGSFEVALALTEPGFLEAAMDTLLGRPAQSGLALSAIVSAVWGSVAALKQMRGRRIRSARAVEPGHNELVLEDGSTLDVPTEQLALIRDVEYRHKVTEFLRPLDGSGVTEFRVTETAAKVTIRSDEVEWLRPPEMPEEEELGVDRRDALLQLLGVEFDGRKWRFTEGGSPLTAAIEDAAFRGRIERQEITFGKNDLLRVRLRTRQYRDATGRLKAEHAIEAVLQHIDGGRQLPFDLHDA